MLALRYDIFTSVGDYQMARLTLAYQRAAVVLRLDIAAKTRAVFVGQGSACAILPRPLFGSKLVIASRQLDQRQPMHRTDDRAGQR